MENNFSKATTFQSIESVRSLASLTAYGIERYMKDSNIVHEFGATPAVLILLWKLLSPHLPKTSQPHHMLWWLYNCKHYPTKLMLEKAL